ncbi:hypothetical protein KR018_004444 [Drosophila ironensis]|nr:hypothetical protein KR018_004444 [Drosophila ironensis]
METPRRQLRNLHLQNLQSISTPLRIPPSPLLKTLGHGTGVSVYRLDRSPRHGQVRSPWAVKRVTRNTRIRRDPLYNERILHEAQILRKLEHPNIVGFRGVVTSSDGTDTLALEMCSTSLGCILEERFDDDLGPLPAKHTLKMIVDVAQGLDFLHNKARLLHGDIKSFNVLVKGDFEICKLCDFGVSLPLDDKGEVNVAKDPAQTYVGTRLWSAPEVIDEANIIDSKADIFSFGLVIYETLALVAPHTLELDAALGEAKGNKKLDYTGVSEVSCDDSKLGLNDEAEKSMDQSKADASELDVEHDVEHESEEEEEDEASREFFDADDTKENDVSGFSLGDMESAYGTRPPLPVAFKLTDEYNCIVELFFLCTNAHSEDRPDARTIWQCLKNNLGDMGSDSA